MSRWLALLLLPGAALAAEPAAAPLGYAVLLRFTGGLLLVVALVFAAAWGVRRFVRLPGNASEALQLLGGIAVGQRERVVLVRVGNQQLLLGVAPGRVQKLHLLDTPADPDAETQCVAQPLPEPPLEQPFKRLLEAFLRRGVAR